MQYSEIIEARRNPEQNPRQETGHDGAVAKLQEFGRDELRRIGVSMTQIDKIGVNPRSIYNTPNGVYFYPADYYLTVKAKRRPEQLPFQDDAPHIQIFRFPEPVLFLDTYTEMDYYRDIKKLSEALDKIPGLVNKVKKLFIYNRELSLWAHNLVQQSDNKYTNDSSIGFESYLNYLGEKSVTEANVQSPGGILWYVTWQLCQHLSEVLNSRAANIWNWVLREKLGYNTVVDYEQGIIYPDEPTQGVVLQTSGIELIKSISNQTPIADLRSDLENMSWAKITDLYEKKRISIHDVRKNVLADAFSSGYSKLIWYLTDIDPNWKYGRNLLVKNFAENRYYFDNTTSKFINYFRHHPQRWPELESVMAAGAPISLLLWYAEHILKVRWPAIEQKLISYLDSPPDPQHQRYALALDYVITHKVRLPQDAEILLALMAKRYGIMYGALSRADIAYANLVLGDNDPKTWHRRVISDAAKQEQTS